jgi:hypothetical protein
MRAILATFALILLVVVGGPVKAEQVFGNFAVEKLPITPAVCIEVGGLTTLVVDRMQQGSTDLVLVNDLSMMAQRDAANDTKYQADLMVSTAIPYIRTQLNSPETLAFLKKYPEQNKSSAIALSMKIKCSKLEGTTYDVPKRNKQGVK